MKFTNQWQGILKVYNYRTENISVLFMHYFKNTFHGKICFIYVHCIAVEAEFLPVGSGQVLLKSHLAGLKATEKNPLYVVLLLMSVVHLLHLICILEYTQ